jgi:hypothetical protein
MASPPDKKRRSYNYELAELRQELAYFREKVQQTSNLEKLKALWERMWRVEIAIDLRTRPWKTICVFVVASDLGEAKAIAELTGWSTKSKARRHLKIVKAGVGQHPALARRYRIFQLLMRESRWTVHHAPEGSDCAR